MDFGANVAKPGLAGGRGRSRLGRRRQRYPGSLLGRFYLLGVRSELRTPSRGAPGRLSLPRSQTFLRAPSEGASLGSPPVHISDVNVSKPPVAGVRGLIPTRRGRLRLSRTQKWGMQPKGQPRSRPKFPPKLRWSRHDPGARGPQREVGTDGEVGRVGAGPTAPAARSMRSRAPGANSQRQAPPQAWCRRSARHPTSPHTCSARRRAQDTWEPSLGLRSSRQELFTSPGHAPFAPDPPTSKGQHAPEQGGGLSAPLSSSDFSQSWKGVSFSSKRPSTPSSFPQRLPFPATSQTDRQETQRRRKTTAPPGPILLPRAGRKQRREHIFPPPPHPESATRAEPDSKGPRGGRGRRGKGGRGRNQAERASERDREREKNIQQNHANAPPTWVQHTLEIEDDQDKGSQASGQHHPANSVHPHHFQQRRLHGFVLPTGTGASGRCARGAGAGTPRSGAEPGRLRAGLGSAREEGSGWLRGGSRSPQPRARVWKTPELLWKCGDAWTRWLRAPAPPAVPPRLSAAASTPPAAAAAASSRAGRLGCER